MRGLRCGLANAPLRGGSGARSPKPRPRHRPKVTGDEVQPKTCGACGAVSVGQAPAHAFYQRSPHHKPPER
jgi:hypothetical protein